MKYFFSFFISIIPCLTWGQTKYNFVRIDQHAIEAPKSAGQSVEKLAQYLALDATNDLEKVRAIYVWITEHIRYDVQTYFSKVGGEEHARRQAVKVVLKNKKAVCQGYSNLFMALCNALNIPAERVTGYTKNRRNQRTTSEHAWNVVRIKGVWYLIDNTWGAGTVNQSTRKFKAERSERFFLASPETFLGDHYPHDPIFQLVKQPILMQDFIKNHVETQQQKLFFTDPNLTLNKYHYLPSPSAKEIDSAERILKFDKNSNNAKYKLASNYFTKATETYNEYRNHKKQFVGNEKLISKTVINKWEAVLKAIHQDLAMANNYTKSLEPGNQYYKLGAQVKTNIREFQSFLRQEKKDIEQFKVWLNHSK